MAFHVKFRRLAGGPAAVSALLSALLACSAPAMAQHEQSDSDSAAHRAGNSTGYALGQGLALGNSGISVGGYASAQWQNLDRDDGAASLSHVSLFVWYEPTPRAKVLVELDDQENHVGHHEREREGSRFLSLERVYLDYSFSDTLTLRAGKFLTPVGRWNQIHADPLVWTTSRPLLTHDLFPDNVTGVMAMGSTSVAGQALDYQLYYSTGRDLRPDPVQDPFTAGYGARLVLPLTDALQLGLSWSRYDQSLPPLRPFPPSFGAAPPMPYDIYPDEIKRLLELDVLWASRGYELSGEVLYRRSSRGSAQDARGGFVQAVAPLSERFSAVARLESICNPIAPHQQRRTVLGLNYRYSRALSLKIEQVRDNNHDSTSQGVLASLSVLF